MRRRGSSMLEAALLLPLLFVLLVGMVEIARVSFTYYSLQKMLYGVARYVGTQQGVNFCDANDAIVTAAKNFGVTGTTDASTDPRLPNLTTDMIQVRIERFDADSEELAECECSLTGCDAAVGARGPDFLVVSLPAGYPILIRIPFLSLEPIPLKPQVRLPYGGT